LDEAGDVLKRGAVLVDEASEYGTGLHVLVTLEHTVRDGRRVLQRLAQTWPSA
jgi:hypothetical protein